MSEKNKKDQATHSARKRLIQAVEKAELLCRGTLLKRTKVCGKKGCRCADDPEARHGPYYEWGRMEGEKLVHKMVSKAQARLIVKAIREHRKIQEILRHWEAKSVKEILSSKDSKP